MENISIIQFLLLNYHLIFKKKIGIDIKKDTNYRKNVLAKFIKNKISNNDGQFRRSDSSLNLYFKKNNPEQTRLE